MKVTLVKFVLKLLLQFLKQRNGFIIHSNTYVNVYWISLGTELYFCSITVTKKKKIFICTYLVPRFTRSYIQWKTKRKKARRQTPNTLHTTEIKIQKGAENKIPSSVILKSNNVAYEKHLKIKKNWW